MKNNIIIFGSSRSGKTTFGRMITEELNYNLVCLDSLVSAFSKSLPQLNINHEDRSGESVKNFRPFLKAYIKSLNGIDKKEKKLFFTFEGSYFCLDDIIQYKDNFEIIIFVLDLATPYDYFNHLKKYDKKFDWSYNLNDKELLEYSKNLFTYNKNLILQCKEHNLKYYNTAINRTRLFKKLIKLMKNNF